MGRAVGELVLEDAQLAEPFAVHHTRETSEDAGVRDGRVAGTHDGPQDLRVRLALARLARAQFPHAFGACESAVDFFRRFRARDLLEPTRPAHAQGYG